MTMPEGSLSPSKLPKGYRQAGCGRQIMSLAIAFKKWMIGISGQIGHFPHPSVEQLSTHFTWFAKEFSRYPQAVICVIIRLYGFIPFLSLPPHSWSVLPGINSKMNCFHSTVCLVFRFWWNIIYDNKISFISLSTTEERLRFRKKFRKSAYLFIGNKLLSLTWVFCLYMHLTFCEKSPIFFSRPSLYGRFGSLLTQLCGISFLYSTWTKAGRQNQWHQFLFETNVALGDCLRL